MKKIFVSIPPKYGITENEARAYILQIEQLALKAEKMLDQYLEIANLEYSFLTEKKPIEDCTKGFIFNCLYNLCTADFAAFSKDWQMSKECRILRSIAAEFDIPILEL